MCQAKTQRTRLHSLSPPTRSSEAYRICIVPYSLSTMIRASVATTACKCGTMPIESQLVLSIGLGCTRTCAHILACSGCLLCGFCVTGVSSCVPVVNLRYVGDPLAINLQILCLFVCLQPNSCVAWRLPVALRWRSASTALFLTSRTHRWSQQLHRGSVARRSRLRGHRQCRPGETDPRRRISCHSTSNPRRRCSRCVVSLRVAPSRGGSDGG